MRKKTNEEFVNQIQGISPNIELLEPYTDMKSRIKCRCKIDGNIWFPSASSLASGRGCPKCAKNYRKKFDEVVKAVEAISPNILIISPESDYKNDKSKLKCKCKLDGYIWQPSVNSLLSGKGCPKCSNHIHKDTDMFRKEMTYINENIEILGEYKTCEDDIKCGCKLDGNTWYATPANLRRGTGCPLCNSSKGERRIASFLDAGHIKYETQKEYEGLVGLGGKNLSYDFYLPSYNLLIEYQGNFHDGTLTGSYLRTFNLDKQKEHDNRKRHFADAHDIKLLEIWYMDFDNIESILEDTLDLGKEETA